MTMPQAVPLLVLLVACAMVLRGQVTGQWADEQTSHSTDFQVVYPVAWHGEDEQAHIPLHDLHSVWRNKRSLRASPTFHLNLSAFGNNFHLELWENKDLLAPGFKIYRRHPAPASAHVVSRTGRRKKVSRSKFKDDKVNANDSVGIDLKDIKVKVRNVKDSEVEGTGVKASKSKVKETSFNTTDIKDSQGQDNDPNDKVNVISIKDTEVKDRNVNVTESKDTEFKDIQIKDTKNTTLKDKNKSREEEHNASSWSGGDESGDGLKLEMREGEIGVKVASDEEVDLELSCQMTGRVRSHGDTPVALSVCGGMRGVIRTIGEDYIIEPIVGRTIPDHFFQQSSGDQSESQQPPRDHLPHKIYRRSSLLNEKHRDSFCGAGGNQESPKSFTRHKRSTSVTKEQLTPSSDASSSSLPSSKSTSTSFTSSLPDTTDHANLLRDPIKKQHVHYFHDNEMDSILEVSSNSVDQLTKLQQFILKENNDFRESPYSSHDIAAMPSFSIPHKDLNPRRQDTNSFEEDFENGIEVKRPYRRYLNSSQEKDLLESNSDGYVNDKDIENHNVWRYLSADHDQTFNGTESSGKIDGGTRKRRSLRKWKYWQRGREKTMEMLVVVDKSMMDRHGNKNITTYTLTLFNMVSKLFQDASLGSKINVVLVGLVLLEGDEPGLTIGHHADKTLNSFCAWQSVLMGSRGRQHDHAVLLSAIDFCSYKNSPCDTLGFAPIGGMCNQIRSCTINEDTGLNTALTIAHEIGHNFGMHHDGDGNYCRQTVGSIMAPTLVSKDGTLQWSVCSRAYLLRFLNTPQSACLDDKSKHVAELKFPDQLPGQLYDADVQCKWQFGKSAQLCLYDFGKDTCKALWCYRGNKRCETKFLPAAEGTSCGPGMWCRDGRCVRYGTEGPRPVHGGWSQWGQWSACSRTCGRGVQTRERECNQPLPQYGGRSCKPEGKQHKLCNVHECPGTKLEDFHSAQCAQYDKKPFRGWYMHWKPYKKLYDAREPCKLYCVAETLNYIFTIKHVAEDGTSCSAHSSNICIEGSCQKVGCDLMINSTAKRDKCGICKGDNTSCEVISGEYSQQPQLNTYFPIVVLPKGARNVKIRERSISSNYLAIRNIYGRYYLNGNRRVAWPGIYTLGGASFQYKRPYNEPETLQTSGPLGEDVILEILVQDTNPGIQYQYTIAESRQRATQPAHNYTWSQVVSTCSQSCAGGVMTVSARCLKNLETEVDARHCDSDNKPKTGAFPCKPHPCPVRWVPDPWTECSRTCGGGRQSRKVLCRQQVSKHKDRKLRRRHCKHLPKPATRQHCSSQECPPQWHARWVPEEWSQCSKSCGGGRQVRRITCRKLLTKTKDRRIGKRHCKLLPKPAKRRRCNTEQCPPDWHTGRWSKCSVQCGEGRQTRKVTCRSRAGYRSLDTIMADERCNASTKPSDSRVCRRHLCRSQLTWRFSAWEQCSVTCGEGRQERNVWCSDGHSHHAAGRCAHLVQPPSSQTCLLAHCPHPPPQYLARMAGPPAVSCVDKESWCHLVREHKACGHSYYRESCCQTCLAP